MNGQQRILVTGLGTTILCDVLGREIDTVRPAALGIASAFVSLAGMRKIIQMTQNAGNPACRLIAGISNFVTHPEALYEALEKDWQVKLGVGRMGIFHPKIIVGGQAFKRDGVIKTLSFAYVGSGNLTHAGLRKNVECGFVASGAACPTDASIAFAELWHHGLRATNKTLSNYAKKFAERNRTRPVEDIQALGIYDSEEAEIGSYNKLLESIEPPLRGAISTSVARAAWAGLESFTGEYRFQVEFPRAAGEVLLDMIARKAKTEGSVPVFCHNDGKLHSMQYRYYADNGMFRLNIPNEIPGVDEARESRRGMVLIEATKRKDAVVQLTILPAGEAADEIIARSVALGTWGKTPTRLFGWF